jgi:hypothetical protein
MKLDVMYDGFLKLDNSCVVKKMRYSPKHSITITIHVHQLPKLVINISQCDKQFSGKKTLAL